MSRDREHMHAGDGVTDLLGGKNTRRPSLAVMAAGDLDKVIKQSDCPSPSPHLTPSLSSCFVPSLYECKEARGQCQNPLQPLLTFCEESPNEPGSH